MDGTIITQGSFVSNGSARLLPIRSDVDWMRVINYTEAAATAANHGFQYYWQRGMAQGTGLAYYHPAADHTVAVNALAANTGFYLYDTSVNAPLAAVVTTGSTNANPPVVTTATTTNLVANQTMVRLSGIAAAPTLCGVDFTVTAVNAGVSFTLPTLANGVAVGGAGLYRIIPFNPLFYPRNRTVCNITQAVNPTVTTTVAHGLTVGQAVRFVVPAVCGMTQLNELSYTATVLTTPTFNTFTMDIDTTGFTAFAWPLIAVSPNSYAQMIPVGETAHGLYANLLDDATLNTGEIGMILSAGILSPAGSNNDVIYWVAGKSFSNS